MRNAIAICVCLASIMVVAHSWSAPPDKKRFDPNERAEKWVEKIDAALATNGGGEIGGTATALIEEFGVGPITRELREAASTEAKRSALETVRDRLRFRPIKEAELPERFPGYTPQGVVELKTYPAYRKAVAKQFFTLFRHITDNDIAMTAPVEMDLTQSKDGRLSQESMAFLYGEQTLGSTGKQGNVNVVDVESQEVVAIGVRGPMTIAARQSAEKSLKSWLAEHPDYQSAGSMRQLSYNSPFVPRGEQFHELQMSVERRP